MHTQRVIAISPGGTDQRVIEAPQDFWKNEARDRAGYSFSLARGAGLRMPMFNFLSKNLETFDRLQGARIEIDLGWPEILILTKERQAPIEFDVAKNPPGLTSFYMERNDRPVEKSLIQNKLAHCLAQALLPEKDTRPEPKTHTQRPTCPA